jgi:hypothetical protein
MSPDDQDPNQGRSKTLLRRNSSNCRTKVFEQSRRPRRGWSDMFEFEHLLDRKWSLLESLDWPDCSCSWTRSGTGHADIVCRAPLHGFETLKWIKLKVLNPKRLIGISSTTNQTKIIIIKTLPDSTSKVTSFSDMIQ